MNVLNVIQCTNLGGMEKASLGLMRALQARGHQFRVISLNPVGALAGALAEAGIPAEGLPYRGPGGWGSFADLRARLRAHSGWADAVLQTGHNLMASVALGGHARGRRVLAVHYHHGDSAAWRWHLTYTAALGRFGAVTFPSDFIRDEAVALVPRLAAKSQVVRYPLVPHEQVTPVARAAARTALGIAPGGPVVVNAGWLIGRKRWDVFLRVAAQVRARVPGAVFLVAGDGPERPALERLAADLGLGDSVRFLGWLANVEPVYVAADVCLFHADWDTFPLTPQEAIGHGVPVVASVLHGGLKELMDVALPGYLLAEHDEPALAERVARLLADPALRDRLGAAARAHLAGVGCPNAIAASYEKLLTVALPSNR